MRRRVLEKALYGRNVIMPGLLMILIAIGLVAYLKQFNYGLGVTDLAG